MEFNVAQLLRQPIGATKQYTIDVAGVINDPDLELTGPLQGRVSLLRTHRGILAAAQLTQDAHVPCVRCLTDIVIALDIHIEDEFVPTVDPRTGSHLHWDQEEEVEETQVIDEKHMLSLHEVVRQELLLALPAHPLCQPDCAGICPDCGADLNSETCNCHSETTDPRWAALAELKESGAGE